MTTAFLVTNLMHQTLSNLLVVYFLKVALSQKILENLYVFNINIPNHYLEQKFWIKLFIVLGGKFKLSAQDSDLEYLCWRCKNSPVSSDLKSPLREKTRLKRLLILSSRPM